MGCCIQHKKTHPSFGETHDKPLKFNYELVLLLPAKFHHEIVEDPNMFQLSRKCKQVNMWIRGLDKSSFTNAFEDK